MGKNKALAHHTSAYFHTYPFPLSLLPSSDTVYTTDVLSFDAIGSMTTLAATREYDYTRDNHLDGVPCNSHTVFRSLSGVRCAFRLAVSLFDLMWSRRRRNSGKLASPTQQRQQQKHIDLKFVKLTADVLEN